MNAEVLEANETYACSSAAGGLRMSVHGLVYNMTVRSAQEAALGAGANIVFMTAGLLTEKDLETIRQSQVKMILLSGGVDYGDTQTALINAQLIAKAKLNLPVVYAGNVVNQSQVREFFAAAGQGKYLYITENVYPKIDSLNVLPVRKIIQEVFEKHITEASGMSKIRQTVNGSIIPTPGAVLKAALCFKNFGRFACLRRGRSYNRCLFRHRRKQGTGPIPNRTRPFCQTHRGRRFGCLYQ